jgi:hypothetical protein
VKRIERAEHAPWPHQAHDEVADHEAGKRQRKEAGAMRHCGFRSQARRLGNDDEEQRRGHVEGRHDADYARADRETEPQAEQRDVRRLR